MHAVESGIGSQEIRQDRGEAGTHLGGCGIEPGSRRVGDPASSRMRGAGPREDGVLAQRSQEPIAGRPIDAQQVHPGVHARPAAMRALDRQAQGIESLRLSPPPRRVIGGLGREPGPAVPVHLQEEIRHAERLRVIEGGREAIPIVERSQPALALDPETQTRRLMHGAFGRGLRPGRGRMAQPCECQGEAKPRPQERRGAGTKRSKSGQRRSPIVICARPCYPPGPRFLPRFIHWMIR